MSNAKLKSPENSGSDNKNAFEFANGVCEGMLEAADSIEGMASGFRRYAQACRDLAHKIEKGEKV